ncbi:MAG: hypothetical protein SFZ03_01190 [Candidatus Melainabacteria bacterium]|nr:hypothetical protein [Candidatus Melainabacteria bacterium]
MQPVQSVYPTGPRLASISQTASAVAVPTPPVMWGRHSSSAVKSDPAQTDAFVRPEEAPASGVTRDAILAKSKHRQNPIDWLALRLLDTYRFVTRKMPVTSWVWKRTGGKCAEKHLYGRPSCSEYASLMVRLNGFTPFTAATIVGRLLTEGFPTIDTPLGRAFDKPRTRAEFMAHWKQIKDDGPWFDYNRERIQAKAKALWNAPILNSADSWNQF